MFGDAHMFHLYSGNRLEDLSAILARILSLSVPDNPFDQEKILVQSPGMAQWLKMYLAEQQGIAAGFEFPLPSTFVWRCFQQSLDDIPSNSEFNKPFLVWRLIRLLDSRLNDPEFQALSWYLAEDDTQIRRFQLCSSIADIYDQYLMYRPDWIAKWEAGEQLPINDASKQSLKKMAEQAWQPILWRDLVADVALHNQSLYHRGNLLDALQEATQSKAKPSAIPDRIFIFGVSALPPNTLQSLRLLAEAGWMDIHLFLQNPCRYYWGDIVDKKYLGRVLKRQNLKPNMTPETLHLDANPLLASWGRLGRDYIGELQEIATQNLDVFQDYHQDLSPEDEVNTAPASSFTPPFVLPSLLEYVQQDILEMENHGALEERTLRQETSLYKHSVATDDNSIAIQICHSALREVEVLHDHLLAMFANDSQLTPKDVIVMLPDVNQYSPFVQAIFGQKTVDQVVTGQATKTRHIPYSLIDQTASLENVVIEAYISLLSLNDSRFTLSELISLLEVPAVLATFGMNVGQIDRVRQWCHEVGIRWGMDASTAENLSLPAQEQNTWHNGLSRMLLGYAIGHNEIWQDILSYGEVEGLEAELAGQLAAFLDAVRITVEELKKIKKPDEWLVFLYQVSERFFTLEENDTFPNLLKKHIDGITDEWQHARFEEAVDISVIKSLLVPRLQETQGSQRFLAGRINFCTLMPMRSVPFKVVCLLGLNEGAYPRSVVPMGFDLMVGDYRSGDRSRREDDKYLFLEAVMSARQRLYISYVGRAVKDNSELNPSILVSELLDYVGQSCVIKEDSSLAPDDSQKKLLQHIITQHKLQPFHESYYSLNQDEKHFSYDSSWLQAVAAKQHPHDSKNNLASIPVLNEMQSHHGQIELEQLVRFYQHPARYFMQHRLNAFLQLQDVEESEDEPFFFDGLTRYQLKEELLQALQKDELDGFIQQLKLSGKYPYGAFGDLEVNALIKQSRAMALGLDEYQQLDLAAINIDIVIDVMDVKQNQKQDRLVAWLPLANHNLCLNYHLGELSAGKKMAVWLAHLAYAAQGMHIETRILSFKNSKTTQLMTHVILPISADKASVLLSMYLHYFHLGDCTPLSLPARTADTWCKTFLNEINKTNDENTDDAMEIAWQKTLVTYVDDFNEFADGHNPYWQRVFPDLSLHKTQFINYASELWLPLHEHFELVENSVMETST